MSQANPVIAIAGNPNVGKTTLFNALTGSRQTVGNWPGVTVELKQGYYIFKGVRHEVIDLPGIYSLSSGSPDEQVARNYILQKKPDLVINVVDASNLERNLYLSVQLMELGAPLLMVLSMIDVADRNGIGIDHLHLSSHLGYDTMPIVLSRRLDIQPFLYRIERRLREPQKAAGIHYDEVVEQHLEIIEKTLADQKQPSAWDKIPRRWLAVKLLERDPGYLDQLPEAAKEEVSRQIKAVERHRRQDSPAVLADDRYGFIRGLAKDVVKRAPQPAGTMSDRIDKFALSGWWGFPIFFAIMFGVFLLAVRASQPLIRLIGTGLEWLFVEQWGGLLSDLKLPESVSFMLADAIGGGVATIGTFIPPIFFIFLSLSILEDSGYMARAAFIADKFMRRVGLPGKAFIPLIVGFGCTVPAIMATRTLESRRDRIFASLLTPFMSCGAKLPVYTYLSLLLFPQRAVIVVFSLYLLNILLGLLAGLALKKTLFKTQPGNFVMELPPYHLPTLNAIFMHTWQRLKDFVLRAGKTILLVIVAVNLLQVVRIGNPLSSGPEQLSILEFAGRLLTPLLAPMGISSANWQATVALISGLFAKEAIVGSLQGLYQTGGNILAGFGGLPSGLAYLIFVSLYSPCAASLAMLFKEHGWRWSLFAFGYLTLLAWIVATVCYQLLAFGSQSWFWLGFCAGLAALFYLGIKLIGDKRAVI